MANVILNIQDNQGYSADQVANKSISLGDLMEALQEAINDHGEDAKVVLHNGQQYGAAYGYISAWAGVFQTEDEDEEE